MDERRQINRIDYKANSVMVVCDSLEKLDVEAINVSPLGMGLRFSKDRQDLVGKDIILVTDTLIMYATLVRLVPSEDGSFEGGVEARKFTPDVLQYLFEHIGGEATE